MTLECLLVTPQSDSQFFEILLAPRLLPSNYQDIHYPTYLFVLVISPGIVLISNHFLGEFIFGIIVGDVYNWRDFFLQNYIV